MTDAYLRFPHLSGHDLDGESGGTVTFVAEDDVWIAPADGGRAWRLSADQVPVTTPRISPDGAHVAWTSRIDGQPEVYVAPTAGGPATRLTYWAAPITGVRGWTADGDVLAVTDSGQPSERRMWAHAVPLDGSPASRLPYGVVNEVAYEPDGAGILVGTPFSREPAWWKRYRGGTTAKLWVDRGGSGEFERILTDLPSSLVCAMWLSGRIAFASDHEGVAQLYSAAPDGSDLRRHTQHEFYVRHASTDGTRVIYEVVGELWVLDNLDDAEPRRLDLRLGGPRTSRAPRPIRAADDLGAVAPDHTGRASAVEVRGTVHWVTHRDGPARRLAVEPGVRARLPVVLGESGQVAWISDAEGEDTVHVAPVDSGADAARRLAAGQVGRVLELAASPDGRWLALAASDGRLLLLDVSAGAGSDPLREITRSGNGEVDGLAFSPDSSWLAWSDPGPEPLRQIRMANLTVPDPSIVDVTPLRFTDFDPAFTPDGKYLAFLSVRSFDPVYDAYVFDLSFPNGCRPQLVALAADTPSPFDPQRHGRPMGDSDDKSDDGQSGEDGGKPESSSEPPRTTVDLEGLASRVVPVPVAAGRYAALRATKSGVIWLRDPLVGTLGDDLGAPDAERPRSTLEHFDLRKRRTEELADGVDEVWVSGDGTRLVIRDGAELRVVPADRKPPSADDAAADDDNVRVDLSRIRITLDPTAEWRQSYAEAGRLMRDHFWRPDMSGVDWPAVLDRYRPVLDRLGSHDDLVDLLWEVHGELGTSHAYVRPPGEAVESERRQGLLGADLEPVDGVWRIARVLPSELSDPHARSPLSAPGVAVRAGDSVLAVDGRPVDPRTGPAPLLVGSAGKPVELTIGPAGGGAARSVVVVPLDDESALRYQDWVNGRRAHVHELSEGRLGYVHVPDMVSSGWAQLHRDLRTEFGREGLVVDVRENRGGHLSQLVIEKLARRVVGWMFGRGWQPTTYPLDAPRGPVVAVANEFSGSDGDIVNAAVKALGIGPVVGTRTWGGVIGIDMKFDLVDGTVVTQPRYATWLSGPGWGVENHGVDPDVEVVMAPQDWVAGRDPQLDTAVRIALDELSRNPAASAPEIPPLAAP